MTSDMGELDSQSQERVVAIPNAEGMPCKYMSVRIRCCSVSNRSVSVSARTVPQHRTSEESPALLIGRRVTIARLRQPERGNALHMHTV